MFIIWGFRSILLTIGTGGFNCPLCLLPRPFKHKRYKRFFTLFFIPLIPVGNGEEFVECQSCKYKFVEEVVNLQQVSGSYKAHEPLLVASLLIGLPVLAISLIVGVCIMACCAIFGIQVINEVAQSDTIRIAAENTKTAIINNFGSENFSLCKKTTDAAGWELSSNAHLMAVNNASLVLWNEYQQQLPGSARAKSRRDLTHVLCLEPSSKEYATDKYGDDDGAVVYTCVRYRRYIDAYLVNVESRKTVGHRKFKGEVPPECPERTDMNLTVYGDDPAPADIIGSLKME
jgi:hypothetical protein